MRTPIRARARTRPPPRPSTNRFFPTPTTLKRSPSRSPRASRKGSACAHSPARLPASRSVEKGSEQRRLRRAGGGGDGDLGGGGGYDGDGCARSLSRRHGGCRGQISGGSGSARARRRRRRLVTSSSCCPRRWCFNNELLAPLRRGSRVGAAGQGFPFPSASVPFPLPRTDSSLPGDAGALGPWRRRSRAWARGRPSTGVGSLRPAKPAGKKGGGGRVRMWRGGQEPAGWRASAARCPGGGPAAGRRPAGSVSAGGGVRARRAGGV